MKKTITFIFAGLCMFLTSCATIMSTSMYPVTISSIPSGATVNITNKSGIEIFNGVTPATIRLDASAGFFSKASYMINIYKNGYREKTINLNATIDGWYFGNFLFGNLLGFLVIDPASGAMYKLDVTNISVRLDPQYSLKPNELKILGINDIPKEWRSHLVRIS